MDQASQDVAALHAENVGGIDETDVELSPGVTVLAGRNATNRTSFLQAVMTAMGSDETTLKGDAEAGVVELRMGDETYRRTLERNGDGVVRSGDSYLDDPSLADLFAFLLEQNEARRAVARGDDLREIIMRPIDTDEIEAEIESLQSERDQIDAQLEHIEDRKRDLPELEQRRSELEAEIEETREALAEKEAEIESLDADPDDQAGESEVDSALAELRETRSELEDVRYDIDTEEESLDSLRTELRDCREELDELPDAPEPDEEIDERLQRLRDEKQRLDADISQLQSAISFNEEMLGSHDERVFQHDGGTQVKDGSVTDQLVEPDTEVTCWTCGSTVAQSNIETTLDELKDRRAEKIDAVSELEDDIESLLSERRERRERVQRRQTVEQRVEGLEDEIDEREQRLDDHKRRADELREEIQSLEEEVEEADDGDGTSEVLEHHREANELEFELGQLESELDSVTEEIQVIEEQLDEESTLEQRREEIGDELVDLRTRIDQVEQEAIEQFNEHMAAILDILAYENIDRIWIERVDREVREGRQKVERTQFELHVVRTTDSGATYEDTVDHLSESEREVTGLIFALAGYLVHELYEEVPFMLLDSLEAIDSERIAGLVDYFADFAPYLVVALLIEDAEALDDEYDRVTEI
ncbi:MULTISPECIES: archaea-specific SMC-related protein [Halorussus]|uniref:archaea-specific SMC-related protein n=1 Tax=Halorussus TaxID=1070314 RepID=UPI000E20FCA2|nr:MULTISPECIES: archaea-specific SMC-related protein [Halorussus]NHN60707.1 AAA family ATPase [Halorussus sp. JP-T4]